MVGFHTDKTADHHPRCEDLIKLDDRRHILNQEELVESDRARLHVLFITCVHIFATQLLQPGLHYCCYYGINWQTGV